MLDDNPITSMIYHDYRESPSVGELPVVSLVSPPTPGACAAQDESDEGSEMEAEAEDRVSGFFRV